VAPDKPHSSRLAHVATISTGDRGGVAIVANASELLIYRHRNLIVLGEGDARKQQWNKKAFATQRIQLIGVCKLLALGPDGGWE